MEERTQQFLDLLIEYQKKGITRKKITEKLNISLKTIERRLNDIKKLGYIYEVRHKRVYLINNF